MNKPSIGYVLSLAVADSVYMGGVMACDAAGLPTEFRYTEPVRATRLQRILYGDALERYLHGDVVAASLLEKLDAKPDVFVVSDPALLPTVGTGGRRAICVSPTRAAPLAEFGTQQEGDGGDVLIQLSDNGSPLRVRFAADVDAAKRTETLRLLSDTGRGLDILEPLARVEAAVRMLWEEAPETPAAPL